MAPCGTPGRAADFRAPLLHSLRRRNERKLACSRRETPSSKHRKLEPKKDAAEGSRKEHTRREEARNSNCLRDFGAREPPRANAMFAIAVDRWCGCSYPYGRRTSLGSKAHTLAAPSAQYNAHRNFSFACLMDPARYGRATDTFSDVRCPIHPALGMGSSKEHNSRCRLPALKESTGTRSNEHFA